MICMMPKILPLGFILSCLKKPFDFENYPIKRSGHLASDSILCCRPSSLIKLQE